LDERRKRDKADQKTEDSVPTTNLSLPPASPDHDRNCQYQKQDDARR
jgi:hypothetical protein